MSWLLEGPGRASKGRAQKEYSIPDLLQSAAIQFVDLWGLWAVPLFAVPRPPIHVLNPDLTPPTTPLIYPPEAKRNNVTNGDGGVPRCPPPGCSLIAHSATQMPVAVHLRLFSLAPCSSSSILR